MISMRSFSERRTQLLLKLRPLLKALLLNALAWGVYLLVLVGIYFAVLRGWQMNWGATPEEIERYMAGDELLKDPELNATRAVEIRASRSEVWPWIVQMGYKRAGYYGFDHLDNGGVPSSDTIMPEYQNLRVGDSIPGGEYKGRTFYLMGVIEMEPERSMLWVFAQGTPWGGATWSWGLYDCGDGCTRLVSRLRQKYSFGTAQEKISWSMIDAIEILMMRTSLLGIKHRAEHK
jgi:hypothetical protein